MLVGEAAPSGPVGDKVLASRAGQFFASAEASGFTQFLHPQHGPDGRHPWHIRLGELHV